MPQPESALYNQLNELHADPHLIVVGSLARAAIMGEEIPPIKPDGSRRDIDFVDVANRLGKGVSGLLSAAEPHRLDGLCQDWIAFSTDVSILKCPYDHRIQEEIRSEVFRPHERRLGDAPVRTFDGRTQLHMQHLMGPLRPADHEPVARYAAHIETRPETLPEELFEPFTWFTSAVCARRQSRGLVAAEAIGNFVHSFIPDSILKCTGPARRKLANGIARRYGAVTDRLFRFDP